MQYSWHLAYIQLEKNSGTVEMASVNYALHSDNIDAETARVQINKDRVSELRIATTVLISGTK